LRFGAVDYLAEVWLNGTPVGGHEGGETPFTLDVTDAVRPGQTNLLAVRVLNPTHEPIDGITLNQTARRAKVIPYGAGAAFNHGGICEPVELLLVPEMRIENLYVTGDVKTGKVRVEITLRNAGRAARDAAVELSIAPASSGETIATANLARSIPAGDTTVETDLLVSNPRLWQLNDPALYRLTARLETAGSDRFDEVSTRFGFRDFRFEGGCFRLNGRRIYLRSTHTCNHFPIGQQFPADRDLLRRDLLNLKAMGFNAVRFIWGGATPTQLDYCDEIGLMVYQESYASMPIADSPKMKERFDTNVVELLRRDRNHPSVVMWGLLNESSDAPAFRHAVAMLPLVRKLDKSRIVILNSGRYDMPGFVGIGSVPGIHVWPKTNPREPWVAVNPTSQTIRALGITWPPGRLAFHPGPANEFSAVRWTAPAAGPCQVSAVFTGFAEKATTDVHVLHNGKAIFDGLINLGQSGNEVTFSRSVAVAAGDTLDFVCGSGNGHYGADTTGLAVTIRAGNGKTYDATTEFSTQSNPNGPWSYGQMAPGPAPVAATFVLYDGDTLASGTIGSLSNPGSMVWEDVVSDKHVYPRVPHTADILQSLRTLEGQGRPVFLSEYGIGSAVDLWRAVRHFEQRGADRLEDAQFFADKLNRFLTDYQQWRLTDTFARPEDFFMDSLRKMAGQRTLGLNAIRANPNIVGHSLTGAIDHVMCGEGLTTLFRELKPGTIDALFDAWAPLRLCLFAEPVHVYRGTQVQLDAVLANEDVLPPGEYPVRIQVIGPEQTRILDRTITLTIPKRQPGREPPLAATCFSEKLRIDGPEGRYRFLATFQRGAAAAGGETGFYVSDARNMAALSTEVVLWGDDPELTRWLGERGARVRPFSPDASGPREVIVAAAKPPAPGGQAAFAELSRRIARGSTAVFLSPEVFAKPDQPAAWLPLAKKGTITPIVGWLYLKDEWAKRHSIFEGMPAGGLMDYDYYREIIPDLVFTGQDPPDEAVAGAIKASQDYASGLMVSVYRLGEGRFVLNTLRIREQLGRHPAAERLLRNMLRYAARDVEKPLAELPADFGARLKSLGY
jgi:hypothetical protein